MKINILKLLGVILCSQFLLVSCSEEEINEKSLEELTSNCESNEPSVILEMDTVNSFKLILPENCHQLNTNIPIKISNDKALFITLFNEILSFNPSKWSSSKQIDATLLCRLPKEYCVGISDYYIHGDDVWIITQKDKNFIFSYNIHSQNVDTLLLGDSLTWNSFPFFGTSAYEYTKNKFYIPFVKPYVSGETALFASYALTNNKLVHENQYGKLEANQDGWTPFSNTPIFSQFINNGYWMCTTASKGVVHFSVNAGKLVQDELICFPASSGKNFPHKFPYEKMADRDFVGSTFITESYNLRLLADSDHVLKFVKKKHPRIDETTQLKYMMNDAKWFIDCYTAKTKTIKRLDFDNRTHYYTSAFLSNGKLIVAKQESEPGVIEFNQIEL